MSAARERAIAAIDAAPGMSAYVRIEDLKADRVIRAHRASLDETDPALVEAIAKAVDAQIFHEGGRISPKRVAITAIIAARNHITGEEP